MDFLPGMQDIKSSNVLLSLDGRAKLADVGKRPCPGKGRERRLQGLRCLQGLSPLYSKDHTVRQYETV